MHSWDKETRSVKVLRGHTGGATSVVFFLGGQRIVSASNDWMIRLRDTRTGDAIGQPLTGLSQEVNAIAVSPDRQVFASGSENSTVRL